MINLRNLNLNNIYHVYNRGTRRANIFEDDYDRMRFLMLMFLSNHKKTNRLKFKDFKASEIFAMERSNNDMYCEIGAYCLLDNHYHFLLREKEEGGISKFLMRLQNAYTKYYNGRHLNSGAVFQGGFKSKHVDTDRYYRYLITYIHLNPIWKHEYEQVAMSGDSEKKENMFKKAVNYNYSSLHDLVFGTKFQRVILEIANFPFLDQHQVLVEDLKEWIEIRSQYSEDY